MKFVETWQVDMEWVRNLVLRTFMFSEKRKCHWQYCTLHVHSLRNIIWSREVGMPRIH